MHKFGFTRCLTENAVFFRYDKKTILIIAVDIDDMLLAANTKGAIEQFKNEISSVVKIKNLGE
ncbi:MAG TPA: reverse transcriptase domain-containing protein, partial [Chlamydiales bacterium]|nr:reverse transcriptase domain-containing protein [Chlamydiales bacterium]